MPEIDSPSPTEWMTAAEAAAYLKVKPRTICAWARQGTIKGYILSGTDRITWRFRAADLNATMRAPAVLTERGKNETSTVQ